MASRAPGRLPVLAIRDLRLLLADRMLAPAAFAFSLVGASFAVLAVTGSTADLSYVLAAQIAPSLVFTLIGGVMADRIPPQRVIIAGNIMISLGEGTFGVFVAVAGPGRALVACGIGMACTVPLLLSIRAGARAPGPRHGWQRGTGTGTGRGDGGRASRVGGTGHRANGSCGRFRPDVRSAQLSPQNLAAPYRLRFKVARTNHMSQLAEMVTRDGRPRADRPGRKWGIRMRRRVRGVFWVELLAATASVMFFLLEIFSREWIERLFGIDPDGGNGSVEWLLASGSLLGTVMLAILARREWSRAVTQP